MILNRLFPLSETAAGEPNRSRTVRTPGRQYRPGNVILEFAFVAILIVFIALGMIEMSRGTMVKEVLANAARDGCRYGTTGQGSNDDIKTQVKKILQNHNINTANATITILVNGAATDIRNSDRYDKISVIVSVPVSDVYWVSSVFLSKGSRISETVVMMMQG